MRQAWQTGRELLEELGKHSGYGAMKEKVRGNASEATRMRNYRGMARRITESELNNIVELCELHGRAWGPTFLVELGRVKKAADRRQLAEAAIQNHWGLTEFTRQIRLQFGQKPLKKQAKTQIASRTGRKRRLDWQDEAEILDELSQLCLGLLRFGQDLRANAQAIGLQQELGLLPKTLREQFQQAAELVAELQLRTERRLKQKTR